MSSFSRFYNNINNNSSADTNDSSIPLEWPVVAATENRHNSPTYTFYTSGLTHFSFWRQHAYAQTGVIKEKIQCHVKKKFFFFL